MGVPITLWNKPSKTTRMNQHPLTHHHGWMGVWTRHSFSLGSCSPANLNWSQKVLQVCGIWGSSNWVVSHFVCPLKVSYYEEGPETKKQIEALMQIVKLMCASNLEYAGARWHCQQNGMDPKGFVETRDRPLNQQTRHDSYIPFAFNRGCLSTVGKIHNIFSSWSAVRLLAD